MAEFDDPIQKAAEALAKQLPVKELYVDALSPAAKEAGHLFTDIVKTLRLALVPFQFAGAAQDRVASFIKRSVKRVPKHNRISPAPQILGPTIEGIRYEVEESAIDQMFSELLSRSMDSGRVDEAHPAYPLIIKQLSSDQAVILTLLKGKPYRHVYIRDYNSTVNLFMGPAKIEVDELPRDEITFPDNVFGSVRACGDLPRGEPGTASRPARQANWDQGDFPISPDGFLVVRYD